MPESKRGTRPRAYFPDPDAPGSPDADWDDTPITPAEIADAAHDPGWTEREAAAKSAFRNLYWVALGLIGAVALLSPEARWFAVLALLGLVVWYPTFNKDLQ